MSIGRVRKSLCLIIATLLLGSVSAFSGFYEHHTPSEGGCWWYLYQQGYQFPSDEYAIDAVSEISKAASWANFDLSTSAILDESQGDVSATIKLYFTVPEDFRSDVYNYNVHIGVFSELMTNPEEQRETVEFAFEELRTLNSNANPSPYNEQTDRYLYIYLDEAKIASIRSISAANNGKITVGFFGTESYAGQTTNSLDINEVKIEAFVRSDFASADFTNITIDNQYNITFDYTSNNTGNVSEDDQYVISIEASTGMMSSEYNDDYGIEDNGSGSLTISLFDFFENPYSGDYTFSIKTINRVFVGSNSDGERFYFNDCGLINEYADSFEVGVEEEDVALPTMTEISNVYPNPFNGTTNINFQLNKPCDVSLKLYDIQGRHVRSLINEEMNAGQHTFSLEIEDLSSGTYFVQMEAGNTVSVKKVMLLK